MSSSNIGGKRPDIPKPRPMCYLAHHSLDLTDDDVLGIIRACAPTTDHSNLAPTEEDFQRWLTNAKNKEYRHPLGNWRFPVQALVLRGAVDGWSDVQFVLNHFDFETSPGNVVRIPTIIREPRRWFSVKTIAPIPESTTQYGADWFLEKVESTLDVVPPLFAFADTTDHISKNLHNKDVEPNTLTWPFMILGPAEVARLGEDRVASAPAWKVAKREDGGYLIQAAPNPFMTPQEDVTALAKHLGLKARR